MLSNPNERSVQRRNKVEKAILTYTNTDLNKLWIEYLNLLLDNKINLLINVVGEEAITIRGEIKCIKHLLSMLEQGDAPFTDSISKLNADR